MIRLPRRASVLLALSLLTAAATAHAECAWVLWDVQSNISSNTAPWVTSVDAELDLLRATPLN
jgi:hypothetical protein